MNLNNLPNLLTNPELAKILRISPLTLRRWGNRGDVKFMRINSRGDRRYKKEDVLEMLKEDYETH